MAYLITWLPDSQRFLETSDDLSKKQTGLVLRTLDDKAEGTIPLRQFASGTPPTILGVTASGDAMVVDQSGYYVSNGYMLVDLKTRTVSSRPFKNIPQGLLVKQIEMSPDRKRLLWKTVNVNPNIAGTMKLMLDQMVLHRDLQFRVNIEVSDLDGGNLHEICGEMLSGKQEDGFQMAHWMPGGKRISFWYQDALYSVPAE